MIVHCGQKAILLVFILFVSRILLAQAHSNMLSIDRREISNGEAFEQAEITGDVTIVLTNEPTRDILLEGSSQDVNNVKIIVKRGKLEINAEKKNLFSK